MPHRTQNERGAARRKPATRLLISVVLGLALPAPAIAQPPGMNAALSCRPEVAPGRVVCELTCRVAPGARLMWADALVTRAPEFVKPLRSRVSPVRGGPLAASGRAVSLAFVAAHGGVGKIAVQARAVVCRGQAESERCSAETQALEAEIRVGS